MDKDHQQAGCGADFLEHRKQVDCGEASATTKRKKLVKPSFLVEPQIIPSVVLVKKQGREMGWACGY